MKATIEVFTNAAALEQLEPRTMMSVTPLCQGLPVLHGETSPALHAGKQVGQSVAHDRIINVNVQLGAGILSSVLNANNQMFELDKVVESILAKVPGLRLSGAPRSALSLSGQVTGVIDLAPDGTFKTATLSLSFSADATTTMQGGFGITGPNVGVGFTDELGVKDTVIASYNNASHSWSFSSGPGCVFGSVKLFATDPLSKKQVTGVAGTVSGSLSINPTSGVVTVHPILSGSGGYHTMQYSMPQEQLNAIYTVPVLPGIITLPALNISTATLFQDAMNSVLPGSRIVV